MPLFIAAVLISLLPVFAERPTPAPPAQLQFRWGEPPAITTKGSISSATLFCTPVVEGGYVGGPIAITITANGKDSELILKQMIANLGEKPVR